MHVWDWHRDESLLGDLKMVLAQVGETRVTINLYTYKRRGTTKHQGSATIKLQLTGDCKSHANARDLVEERFLPALKALVEQLEEEGMDCKDCPTCGGIGRDEQVSKLWPYVTTSNGACTKCHGTGKVDG